MVAENNTATPADRRSTGPSERRGDRRVSTGRLVVALRRPAAVEHRQVIDAEPYASEPGPPSKEVRDGWP
jgi:hypothetical protein